MIIKPSDHSLRGLQEGIRGVRQGIHHKWKEQRLYAGDKYHLQVLQFRFNGTVTEASANQHVSAPYATPHISHQVAEKHEPKRESFFIKRLNF